MPCKLHTISAAVLAAAVLLCVHASPVMKVIIQSSAGDASGEEAPGEEVKSVMTSNLLSTSGHLDRILDDIKLQKKFEDEFMSMASDSLEQYKIPSLPKQCPSSNFTKEACLRRLVHGLSTYTFLLKHVEKEYPGNSNLLTARENIGALIDLLTKEIRDPESVVMVTGSQEEQLQKELDNPDEFHRKMTAYSLLGELRIFLVDASRELTKRALAKQGRLRERLGRRTTPSQ